MISWTNKLNKTKLKLNNSTKFLGLINDSTFSWNDHIAELTSDLNKTCSAVRAIKPFMSVDN